MAIIMGKGCLEAIYGLMGWKGLKSVGIFEGKEEGLLISATRPPPPWIRRSSIDFQTNNSAAITGSVDT